MLDQTERDVVRYFPHRSRKIGIKSEVLILKNLLKGCGKMTRSIERVYSNHVPVGSMKTMLREHLHQ